MNGGTAGKEESDFWHTGLAGLSPTRLMSKIGMVAKMTKTDLDKTVLKPAHPALISYNAFNQRVRFLRGFSSKAIEVLRVEVFERMAKATMFQGMLCVCVCVCV